MGEINYSPLKEADAFDASSLNTRQGEIKDAINDIADGAVAVGALNENHLPVFTKVTAPSDVTIRVGAVGATHAYTQDQVEYPTFVPIDSAGSAGGGTDLELDFGSGFALAGEVQGILVLVDIHIQNMTLDVTAVPPAHLDHSWAGFRVEVSLDGIAWTPIDRSFRVHADPLNAPTGRWSQIKVSLKTLVLAADLAAVRYVRVTMTQRVSAVAGDPDAQTTLRECHLSAVVLKSKKV